MIHIKLLTDYLVWGDHRLINILDRLTDNDYNKEFNKLSGNISNRSAHIVSIYEFFLKILEGKPYDNFPDLNGLTKNELLSKWKNSLEIWQSNVNKTKDGLYGLPLAGGKQVDVKHIYVDAMMHTVHHRAQILTFIRLLGKTKDDLHPKDTNLDYLMYLFSKHPEMINEAEK